MIRDVAQLREHGQVERRVDELDVDVATWRAGMRAGARREGMRIRTFLVEPADPLTDPDTRPDPTAGPPPGTLVFAVRTDLPVDPEATPGTSPSRAAGLFTGNHIGHQRVVRTPDNSPRVSD